MKITPNNIDEVLKKEFQDFAPEHPDVWSGIEQELTSTNPVAPHRAAQSAIKGGIASTKTLAWVSGIAILAASVVAYVAIINKQVAKEELPKPQLPELTMKSGEKSIVTNEQNIAVEKVPMPEFDAKQIPQTTAKKIIRSVNQRSNQINENIHIEKRESPAQENTTQNRTEANTEHTEPIERPVNRDDATEFKAQLIHKQENNSGKNQLEATRTEKSQWEYEEEARLKIPGSFSPNGDSFNDDFVVEIENEEAFHLMILDLSGKSVFETHSKEKRWNGLNRISGEECGAGWYVYTLIYRLKGADAEQVKSGKFKLVR
jgi:gliding motility-associated-like protein